MTWNPLDLLRRKLGGAPAADAKPPAVPAGIAEAAAKGGELPDMKELEKKGLLGQFFRRWKDPAFLRQLKAVTARMQKDGVDLKDKPAVQAWLKTHQSELESGSVSAQPEPPKPFVRSGPELGRNDPCKCGSGKKYKKCCGK